MKTSIIIPFYNHWELTHRRLSELYIHIPAGNVDIVLVNDGSTDKEIPGGVAWWQKQIERHTIWYKNRKENGGFGVAMNDGAKVALKHGAELLIFLSNDVIVSGNFFPEVNKIIDNEYKVLIGGEVIRHAAGWNEWEIEGKKIILPWANGWFLACTDVIWQSLGGFDPLFSPTDFEDVDLSTTALDLGYNLVALNSVHLRHLGAQTAGYTPERMERTKLHREIYFKKWQNKLLDLHNKIQ